MEPSSPTITVSGHTFLHSKCVFGSLDSVPRAWSLSFMTEALETWSFPWGQRGRGVGWGEYSTPHKYSYLKFGDHRF